ncbi:MAG: hypothetical protein ABEJ70_08320 [Halobacteriaceae archaeon]
MSENTRLDTFLSGADETPPPDRDDGVEALPTTYRFDPAGGPCADCGAVVERRWQTAAGPVCGACKAWDA